AAGADEAQHRGRGREHHLGVAGEERLRGGAAALVLHRGELHAGDRLEQHRGEVRRGAEARGRVEELPRVLPRIVDKLAQAVERLAVVHNQHGCAGGHAAHGGEILLLVVRSLVERDVDRVVRRVHQRVAVGGRLGHDLRGDVAACARAVVGHHRDAQVLRHLVGDEPCEKVARAARRKAHDYADRLGGEGLRERRTAEKAKEQDAHQHEASSGALCYRRPRVTSGAAVVVPPAAEAPGLAMMAELLVPAMDELLVPASAELLVPAAAELLVLTEGELLVPVSEELLVPVTDELLVPVSDELLVLVSEELLVPVTDELLVPVSDELLVLVNGETLVTPAVLLLVLRSWPWSTP